MRTLTTRSRGSRIEPLGRVPALVLATVLVCTPAVRGADVDDVTSAGAEKIREGQRSQQTIDQVVSETESLEAEYERLIDEIDGLGVYNAYMQRQVERQDEELLTLERSMSEVSDVERQIVPLMLRMLDGLEQFVELDLPFLLEERRGRVAMLQALMERADVSVAEKFRRVTEAFQIENDFGRTIEAYKETLQVGEATIEASVLRLGRVGLYFQTNDASMTGRWNPSDGEWVLLTGGSERNQVRQGIRIANRQVAPDLLLLDVPAPEVAP